MADLDAELLALAGGDSSDEEVTKPTTSAAKPVSPHSPSNTSLANVNEPSTSKVNSTPKIPSQSRAGSKTAKRSKMNESEEEGEA